MKILLGTSNPAKIARYKALLKNIEFTTLVDLNLSPTVEEGASIKENAFLKAKAHSEASKLACLASDNALKLDFLPKKEQPEAYVRRVFGCRLNDQELLEHYCALLRRCDADKKKGRFILSYCLYLPSGCYFSTEHVRECEFRLPASRVIEPGYPLESINFILRFNKMGSELTERELEEFDDELRVKLENLIKMASLYIDY